MENVLDRLIAKNIKEVLKQRNMRQITLCEATGIKPGYLSELLNSNPKRRWNTDNLEKICKALNLHPVMLFLTEIDFD